MKKTAISDRVIDSLLARVQKPARYCGGELGCADKTFDGSKVRVALAFPDKYEVGMSNLGLRILYHVLNSEKGVFCDRVYAPDFDACEIMRSENIPLFALDSRVPVKDFDILGFSLAYEMCFTTVLDMLDMAGIPVRSRDRREDDPVIIAGGHCAHNPMPMADFVDAFLIGDGEEVIVEVARARKKAKNRDEALRLMSEIEGVYVPALWDGRTVYSRRVADLDAATFPDRFIVPFTDIVHNRVTLEVMRGCTGGCRFCQAGMITRPVRERSAATIERQAKILTESTGYNEVALTSLSSADYSAVNKVIADLIEDGAEEKVSVSLPSLRADADCVKLAAGLQKVRKSGLTFAPEAGSQRLRNVINKNVTAENLLSAAEAALDCGWRRLKLYFMVGLPTETDDDLRAIGGLVHEVIEVAKSKHVPLSLNLTLSPFVPKPHTPFQRCGMVDRDELERRVAVARDNLRGKNIFLSWHDPACSRIEAAVARGDRKVGEAVYNAWRKGAKLEQENFVEQRWIEAFAEAGITIEEYANREIGADETLPWGFIDSGVSRAYLEREYEKALREETTTDCRRGGCTGCGLREKGMNCPPKPDTSVPERPKAPKKAEPKMRVSVLFKMAKSAKWIGHLDLLGVMERAVRMAKIDAVYTEGFNPRIKMSLASALPLGASSDCELFTLVVNAGAGFDANKLAESLNGALPRGVRLREPVVRTEHAKAPVITGSEYEITVTAPSFEGLDEAVKDFMSAESFEILRKSGGKKPDKNIDARKGVAALTAKLSADAPEAVVTVNLIHMEYTVKPSEIAEILARRVKDLRIVDIHRSKLTAKL
ncbi:MAG: TIGR03960 family B12-binding radical SAM protein [Abditibacteriota bacterium]|nr:TIGR03960 family B12-binding radical SAM protein [Abditibacteriota bacterium]